MLGIVACEGLYNLVQRYRPDAAVEYVPAELHEFPVNVPLDATIVDRIQTAIDTLDTPDRDRIVVSYALDDAENRLSSAHAPLVIADEIDCISTVLPDTVEAFGENKAPGTLYLTRGWIDCGVDSYKLYRAYRDDLEGLIAEFEGAAERHPDLRYTWHRGDRFRRAITQASPSSGDLADEFFRSVVEHYHRVALVDTGDLYEVHHGYARRTRRFIERLKRASERDTAVALTTIEGETDRFQALLEPPAAGG